MKIIGADCTQSILYIEEKDLLFSLELSKEKIIVKELEEYPTTLQKIKKKFKQEFKDIGTKLNSLRTNSYISSLKIKDILTFLPSSGDEEEDEMYGMGIFYLNKKAFKKDK